jgi:hypothetical protein
MSIERCDRIVRQSSHNHLPDELNDNTKGGKEHTLKSGPEIKPSLGHVRDYHVNLPSDGLPSQMLFRTGKHGPT